MHSATEYLEISCSELFEISCSCVFERNNASTFYSISVSYVGSEFKRDMLNHIND